MTDNLRPYGPGKFTLMIDAYVYDLTLDGPSDECGQADTTGWYGLMEGALYELNAPVHKAGLTEDERAFLAGVAGAIVSENSQGFVYVEYYETAEALRTAWEAITAEVAEDEDDDDDTPHVTDEVIRDMSGMLVSIDVRERMMAPSTTYSLRGTFTGERDIWGKWTFQDANDNGTLYFFTDEVLRITEAN